MPATAPSSLSDADRPTGSPTVRSAPITLIAVIAGVVGAVLCVITPLLPVSVTQASFDWPQHSVSAEAPTPSVTAPLIAQTAESLDVTIDCAVLRGLPAAGGVVLATMPTTAPDSKAKALYVTASRDAVSVTFRNVAAASIPRAELAACARLHAFSSATATGAQFVGPGGARVGNAAGDLGADARPQIDGMFTDLSTAQVLAAGSGVRAHVQIDNRYESTPSVLKLLVMILAVLCVVVSLGALFWLDRLGGYRRRVGARTRWARRLRPSPIDLVVTAVLGVWTLLGAGTPDDGYILNMGRTAGSFGYLSDYYRFYGIPEAPFDWYYAFLGHWSALSPSLLWMLVPQLVAGLASWFVLSRVLLPRLGGAVSRSRWAMWSAALVFAAFWLPFCSGLRSESMIVLGSLVSWWAAEKAIATRALLPAALAAIAAGFTLALAPQGLIGVAILIVAARPLLHILLVRRREEGLAPLVAPIVAAGVLVLVVVFRDQTVATVIEAIKVRYATGPVIDWNQEYLRYYFLTVNTKDGALTRRVPVLLLLAALIVTVAVMLRRSRISGVAPGPAWRLIGAVGVSLLLLAFTPTKWTIQFGIFAGLGAALAATATVAVAQSAARSTRNLTVFVSGLFFALAAAMAGKNAWPYAYEYGISWFDRAPVVAGIGVSTIFLVLAVVAAALAVWQHLRLDYVANRGLAHGDGHSRADRRRLVVASSPIAIIATLMVISEVMVFAKAVAVRYPAFTVFGENLNTVRGDSCGMADKVLVESDPNANMLRPAGGETASAALSGTRSGATSVGFSPDGVPDDLSPKPGSARPGQMNVAAPFSQPFAITGGLGAGTTGGRGPRTVNGSTAALPYGLDPATTPVLGSYGYNGEARLTTDWYDLPERNSTPLLVFSAAGSVASIDMFGVYIFGRQVVVQFGRPGPDGSFEQVGPDALPIDPGPVIANRPWRNLRVPMAAAPPAATVMRLSLLDDNLGEDQFLVITPPRAPKLATLQQVVGSDAPTLIDFSVAAHFPCQQPLQVTHGVAQVPRWRIQPDFVTANSQSKTWEDGDDGGLLAISEGTTSAQTVPTYLSGDWYQGWGALEKLTPLVAGAPAAALTVGTSTRWGWARTGSIRVESSDDQ
ncbi:cell wall arabinan synthesis protein [Gordonia polyisoprenivorans VH2]|uniref:Cell wall arabinan synthesis protein n=1 Tax=Gordonia polyisoprenivorans (strain DSM 44266 / VH2) TaxID=1112204 RepID=H6MU19_GORPV|nr:arabinosyltransferase domain-containing protein [Gordonia polyisoprenivorans]AFA71496.1 cell wall arabinan synthesis protein [Gordonia polyisoprenivorans VH2]